MSYNAQETARDSGRPVELYEFRYTGAVYRYTTAAEIVTRHNADYTPAALERDAITESSEPEKQQLQITGPRDLDIAQVFRSAPPSEVVSVTLYRRHLSDASAEFVVFWSGRVLGAQWQDSQVALTCESVLSSVARIAPRRRYSLICPHQLYGTDCRAVRDLFKTTGTVSAISGTEIVTDIIKPADWFAGGYIQWTVPQTSRREVRAVTTNNNAGQLVLNGHPAGLRAGMAITAYAGCDHSIHTCKTKFDNIDNYGGFPFFPDKNPFGGNPIY